MTKEVTVDVTNGRQERLKVRKYSNMLEITLDDTDEKITPLIYIYIYNFTGMAKKFCLQKVTRTPKPFDRNAKQ